MTIVLIPNCELISSRVSAQLELDFNSVERIGEYLRAPQEARTSVDDKRPPAHWPSAMAQLIVENLVVRYAPDLPPVLDGISFTINANEKIGVVSTSGPDHIMFGLFDNQNRLDEQVQVRAMFLGK